MRTPTGSLFCTRCGSSAASCRCLLHFPPRAKLALHEAVLNEILEERVVSSRGRRVPRGGQARGGGGGGEGRGGGGGGERGGGGGAAGGKTQEEQLSAAPPRTTANHPDRFHHRYSDRKMNSIGPSPGFSSECGCVLNT